LNDYLSDYTARSQTFCSTDFSFAMGGAGTMGGAATMGGAGTMDRGVPASLV